MTRRPVTNSPMADPGWSAREREVLDLVTRGCTNAEIAERLGITFATAKWHVGELISRLGVESREDVAAYWRERRKRSFQRMARGFLALGSLKLAAGVGGVAVIGAATAGAFATVQWPSDGGGGDLPAAAETVTVTVTTPTSLPGEVVVSTGQEARLWSEFPELVALDQGGCSFEGVDFETIEAKDRGSMSNIVFPGCNLRYANFSRVFLNGADFTGSDLTGAAFWGASIAAANFTSVDARGANFAAVLMGTRFRDSNLEGASMRAIQVDRAVFSNTICPDGTNSDAHGFTCLGTPGVELVDPATSGPRDIPTCEPALLPRGPCPREGYEALSVPATGTCDYTGSQFQHEHLNGADFRGCTFIGANLSDAALISAWFDDARLVKTNLRGAVLARASFAGADLSDADLTGALLAGVNFHGANLTRATLSPDFFDQVLFANTTCPDGTSSDLADGDGRTCRENLLP